MERKRDLLLPHNEERMDSLAFLGKVAFHRVQSKCCGDGEKGPPVQVTYNPGAQGGPKSVQKLRDKSIYLYSRIRPPSSLLNIPKCLAHFYVQ